VVVPIAGVQVAPALRVRVTRALDQGLQDSGVDVVSPAPGSSETSTAAEIAGAAGATFLMRGTVEAEGRSYTFRLEMVDGKSGAVVASREDRCEICTETEALETANTAASTLKSQAFSRTITANGAAVAGGAELAVGSGVGAQGASAVARAGTPVPPTPILAELRASTVAHPGI